MRLRRRLWLLVLAPTVLAGCGGDERGSMQRRIAGSMRLTSAAFPAGGRIPARFTCDGANVSPPLAWSSAPDAGELAIVMRDVDSPGGAFVHWVLAGLPPETQGLTSARVPSGADQLPNSSGTSGYRGPCPPRGDRPHRYVFTIYALTERPTIASDTPPAQAREAIVRAASTKGSLTASYSR